MPFFLRAFINRRLVGNIVQCLPAVKHISTYLQNCVASQQRIHYTFLPSKCKLSASVSVFLSEQFESKLLIFVRFSIMFQCLYYRLCLCSFLTADLSCSIDENLVFIFGALILLAASTGREAIQPVIMSSTLSKGFTIHGDV